MKPFAWAREYEDMDRGGPNYVKLSRLGPPDALTATKILSYDVMEPWRVGNIHKNDGDRYKLIRVFPLYDLASPTDPTTPKCGWCRDSGMAPWLMGDFMRTCKLCEKGQEMRDLGYGIDPFLPATVSKEEAEKFLGPLTDEEYESIMEQYSKLRREAL